MAGRDFSNLTEQEKLDLYRKEISCYASKGKIPPLAQFRLDLLREDLGISSEAAQEIETEVFIPFVEYQKNLALFKEAVSKEIDDEFHISKESHEELEKLRLQIGIKLEDASRFFAENCIENPSVISSLIIRFHKLKSLAFSFQSLLSTKLENLISRVFSLTRNNHFLKISLIFGAIVFSIFLVIPAIAQIIPSSPVAEPPVVSPPTTIAEPPLPIEAVSSPPIIAESLAVPSPTTTVEPPLSIEAVSSPPIIAEPLAVPSPTIIAEPPLPVIEPVLNTIRPIKSFRASNNLISSISTNTQNANVAFATYNPLSWFSGKDNTVSLLKNLDHTIPISSTPSFEKLGVHQGWVNSVAFSSNGKLIGSASDDKTIRIWNVTKNIESATFTDESLGRVSSLIFSPDGSLFATSSSDKEIRFWSTSKIKLLKRLDDTHFGPLAFSPDNLLIASGGDNGTINIFNVPSMQNSIPAFVTISYHRLIKHSLIGHTQGIKALSFSPNGKLIASGGFDDTVKVWNVQTGREIRSFSGHTNDVNSVLFSADSKSVISGSNDGTIKIWNIDDGSVSTTQTGKKVTAIAFGQDKYKNEIIISAGMGDISIWKPQYITPNA